MLQRVLVGLGLISIASALPFGVATAMPGSAMHVPAGGLEASPPQGTWASARDWQVVWRRPLGFVTQAPRLGNGLVYAFVGEDVVAIDAATGEVRWQYVAPQAAQTSSALGCPCASTTTDFNGKDLYVLAGGNELRALDARTGRARWARPVGEAVVTPTVSFKGIVVVGATKEGGTALHGLDERSGAPRWQTALGSRLIPWLALDGATVLAVTGGRRMWAVDARSGRVRWAADLADALLPSPDRVGGGALALTTYDGVYDGVRVLETASGSERWSVPLEGGALQPLLASGRIFIATFRGQVLALDGHTGQRLWTAETTQPVAGENMVLGEGVLYVPTHDQYLLALDAADGQVRWTQSIGQMISPPVVKHGVLLAGTVDGDLVVLDLVSGNELARVKVGETVLYSPLVDEGLVYVATYTQEGGLLVALRPNTL